MSRGHGSLQRTLIAILEQEDRLLDTFEAAALAFEYQPDANNYIGLTDSQLNSVKRALGKLATEGRICGLGRHWHNRRARWPATAPVSDTLTGSVLHSDPKQ